MSLFAAKLGTFFHVTNNLAIYFLLKHDFMQTFLPDLCCLAFFCRLEGWRILSLQDFVLNLYRLKPCIIKIINNNHY